MANHIVMSEKDGASFLSQSAAPEFSSDDFPGGWEGMGVEASGVFIFVLKVAADAEEFPIHASEDEWLGYVVSGSGTLYAGTAESEKTEGKEYSEGDFVTFEANTPHGWVNAGGESKILFAKKA